METQPRLQPSHQRQQGSTHSVLSTMELANVYLLHLGEKAVAHGWFVFPSVSRG